MNLLTHIAAGLPDTVPFVGPEAIERAAGIRIRARIGANESPFGPSPKVIAAMQAAATDVWKYGDPEVFDLRAALAAHLGVAHANVTAGEGIDGLHCLIARLVIEPGDVAVTSLGAYPTFNYHVAGFGGRIAAVPYVNDHEHIDGLLAAARAERAKVIYVSNPDNPMGTWWNASEIQRLIDGTPEETLLLLDEAYGETAPDSTMPPLDVNRPNVLRTRTFSKAYGLAGMRVGYVIGPSGLIKAFDRVRNHFGISRMSQAAAMAALADQIYLQDVVAKVAHSRDEISRIARANGLIPIPSATNFVAVDCGRDGDYALRVLKALEARGVFVRKPMAPVLNRCIRISAGPAAEMAVLEAELPGALRAAG